MKKNIILQLLQNDKRKTLLRKYCILDLYRPNLQKHEAKIDRITSSLLVTNKEDIKLIGTHKF